MKILYISQYFFPEVGATTNRALANVRHLTAVGHEVTVLTEMPNHPQGVIREDYRGKFFLSEKMESFLVKRFWVFTSPKKTFYSRIFFYLSFALFSSVYLIFKLKKYDLIYLTSPPLFVALPGLAGKLLSPRKKIFFEVRDLWPDSAIDMGELNNKAFIKLSYNLEKLIYHKSEMIISVTKYIKKALINKGIEPDKIEVVYNGIEADFAAKKLNERIAFMDEKKQEGFFLVIYAGILGLAQNLTTVLQAAKKLKQEKVFFIIAGSGPQEEYLHNLAGEWQLNNLHFTGEIPRDKIHNYLLSADCGIVPLQRIPVFRGALTSKLFEYLALGLPVLLGVEGEAADILNKTGGGLHFIPEDAEDLSDKILYLRDNPPVLKKMRGKGKNYVLDTFNRKKQAERLEKIIADRFD